MMRTGPALAWALLWPGRALGLVRQLAARDVAERYRGQWLGWVWLVLAPLLMVAVYTLVLRHAMGLKAGQYKAVVEHWGEEQEGLAKQQEQLLRSKEVRGEKRRRDIWFFFKRFFLFKNSRALWFKQQKQLLRSKEVRGEQLRRDIWD